MPSAKILEPQGSKNNELYFQFKKINHQFVQLRNENHVQYDRLAQIARTKLNESAERVMAVLDPLKLVVTGLPEELTEVSVPNFPQAPEKGSHSVPVDSTIFIDESDFRLVDSEDYFGLAPNKAVNLKYIGRVICDSVELDPAGKPVLLKCSYQGNDAGEKPKGTIQWVPAKFVLPVEVRLYNLLFTVDEPSDVDWEQQLNPQSEIVKPRALVDASLLRLSPQPEMHLQFERLGFFVVDKDSKEDKLIFNLTVNLKDSKPKLEGVQNRWE